ncbi:amidase family protein [Nemania sp. FL0031]|nr:amidase family protein [Nemania sp. FL0031]
MDSHRHRITPSILAVALLVPSLLLLSQSGLAPFNSCKSHVIEEFNPFIATASAVQELLHNGRFTSEQLVQTYLDEIDKNNGYLRAVTSIPPREWLFAEARRLDQERRDGKRTGPLHGIPILIKDIIDTEPSMNMSTTWGSLSLAGTHPQSNARIIDMLRGAGAIILAKTSLSEWGWFRGVNIPSGWCAVAGQGQSPYVRGGFKSDDSPSGHSNPAGSSSGSAIGVAAGFAPISIGAESTGSLMMPACRASLYSIKPTVGIVPGDGCLSISLHHDILGPMAKSARDIADILDVIVDPIQTNIPEGGYAAALTGKWDNIRVGVVDAEGWMLGFPYVKPVKEINEQMLSGWTIAYRLLKENAARFEKVHLISIDDATANGTKDITNLSKRDFRGLLKSYLATIPDAPIHNIKDLIKFNQDNAQEEMPPYANNQDIFLEVQSFHIPDAEYDEILEFGRRKSRQEGIDKVMKEHDVNIIVAPSDSPLFLMASLSAYPIAAVPFGNVDFEGNNRPYGLFAIATAHQDALLVEFMSAWEAVAPIRQPPLRTKFE